MSTVNPKYLDIERNGVTYHIPVGVDPTTIIDDTTGSGDTDKVWSANKLVTELSGKVNTETGKGLSTNDFTTAEKNKLGALESATYDEYTVTIATTDWTQGVSGYSYTYSNQNITADSDVDILLRDGARDSYLDDLSYEKATGSITFTTSSLPVAAVPLTIKVTGIVSTSTITNNATELSAVESGMAIVVNGDIAPKNITAGQYLFIKNHSTLATGGYHATAAIYSGASITSNNVSADEDGLVNAVKTELDGVEAYVQRIEANNAGSHNCIYRGKYLGSSVTSAQWNAIDAGTFDDLFIGDYWTINNINWRIAAFDYWFNCNKLSVHHIVIVPDEFLTSSKLHNTNTTTMAYYNSDFRKGTNGNTGRSTAISMVNNAFGSDHILVHTEYLNSSGYNGYPNGQVLANDCTVELMNEEMVYGCHIFAPIGNGSTVYNNYTHSKSQLPLFRHDHSRMIVTNDTNGGWWLRNIVATDGFSRVHHEGHAARHSPSNSLGIRPAFGIRQTNSID